MVKTQGNLFFTWVPHFSQLRKNLIFSRLWVYQLFKIMTPDSFLKLPRILSLCIQENDCWQGAWKSSGQRSAASALGPAGAPPAWLAAVPGSAGSSGPGLTPAGVMGTNPARISFCTQESLTEHFFSKLLREPDPSLCGINSEAPTWFQWGRVSFSICVVLREYWDKDWQAWQLQKLCVWKTELYECLFSS